MAGQLINALASLDTVEIEAAGMLWRVRKLSPAEFMEAGAASAMLAPAVAKDAAADEEAARRELVNLAPEKLGKLVQQTERIAALCIVAVGDVESGEFEDVRFVLDRHRQDPASSVLWVGVLPPEVTSAAFNAALRISGGTEVAERLASFRGRSKPAATA